MWSGNNLQDFEASFCKNEVFLLDIWKREKDRDKRNLWEQLKRKEWQVSHYFFPVSTKITFWRWLVYHFLKWETYSTWHFGVGKNHSLYLDIIFSWIISWELTLSFSSLESLLYQLILFLYEKGWKITDFLSLHFALTVGWQIQSRSYQLFIITYFFPQIGGTNFEDVCSTRI